jgi:hypothetical protein
MTTQNLHREAMEIANRAFEAQRENNHAEYLKLTAEAYEKEKTAAWTLFNQFEAEPTRSILFRSAAQLAFNCGKMRDSEQLISAALAGSPPLEIRKELRNLLITILPNFELS